MGQKKPQDKTPFWNDLGFRSVLYQIVAIAAVVLIGWYLVDNTLTNLAVRQINTGFGYLSQESSFAVSESVIAFAPSDTYGRALVVGLLNTLRVALVGIVLATIVGVLVGVAGCRATGWSPGWRPSMSRRCATYRCCCSSSSGMR